MKKIPIKKNSIATRITRRIGAKSPVTRRRGKSVKLSVLPRTKRKLY